MWGSPDVPMPAAPLVSELCLHRAAAQWRGRERTAAELAKSPCFGSYFEMFLMSLLQGDGCWGKHADGKA